MQHYEMEHLGQGIFSAVTGQVSEVISRIDPDEIEETMHNLNRASFWARWAMMGMVIVLSVYGATWITKQVKKG